jgi:DNA-binding response OmpR family regulator
MAKILLVSAHSSAASNSGLALLPHSVQSIGFDPGQIALAQGYDLLVLDARSDLISARSMARVLQAAGAVRPILVLVKETALATLSDDWGLTDFALDSAGPGELDARIRLCLGPVGISADNSVRNAGLIIDVDGFTAKVNNKALDLTFKEFELLRYLVDNPGRVFSREQLLSEVWGYDYFGGTRTVDVHIRRLRSKLGELESLIGTVRNVGYRLNRPGADE